MGVLLGSNVYRFVAIGVRFHSTFDCCIFYRYRILGQIQI